LLDAFNKNPNMVSIEVCDGSEEGTGKFMTKSGEEIVLEQKDEQFKEEQSFGMPPGLTKEDIQFAYYLQAPR